MGEVERNSRLGMRWGKSYNTQVNECLVGDSAKALYGRWQQNSGAKVYSRWERLKYRCIEGYEVNATMDYVEVGGEVGGRRSRSFIRWPDGLPAERIILQQTTKSTSNGQPSWIC